jgi:hypothetical protein
VDLTTNPTVEGLFRQGNAQLDGNGFMGIEFIGGSGALNPSPSFRKQS